MKTFTRMLLQWLKDYTAADTTKSH